MTAISIVFFVSLIALTTIGLYEMHESSDLMAVAIKRPVHREGLALAKNQSRAQTLGCHEEASILHMVPPPTGGLSDWLVCCQTTQGPLSIAVRQNWAPLGAKRFLQLVDDGHFDVGVPLFRCLKNFICQFGLSSESSRNRRRYKSLPDDPNWLPEGPTNQIFNGRKRFPKGYLAYAGAGKNSRSIQLIVALQDSRQLAGGSPWEVPWGELLGNSSFATLDRIYTGYGEKGPSQGVLSSRGWSSELSDKFPLLDHIQSCFRVKELSDAASSYAPLTLMTSKREKR